MVPETSGQSLRITRNSDDLPALTSTHVGGTDGTHSDTHRGAQGYSQRYSHNGVLGVLGVLWVLTAAVGAGDEHAAAALHGEVEVLHEERAVGLVHRHVLKDLVV
jgi:hypothetical protein